MMPLQRFVLLVDGANADILLRECEGLSADAGSGRVAVQRGALSLAEAVASAVRDVESVGLRPVRVDARDWVTLSQIASRIGRSREIVRLWSIGRQGPGDFPPPLNPGSGTSFYSWAEVTPWLRERMGYDVPDDEPVLAAMNLAIQLRRLAPRLTTVDALQDMLTDGAFRRRRRGASGRRPPATRR